MLNQFRWRDHSDAGAPKDDPAAPLMPVGLVAQQLYKVAPYCVARGDGKPEMRRGDDETNVIWALDIAAMLATLTGAVQQLAARVAALEAKT
jgi:hypothetical protein